MHFTAYKQRVLPIIHGTVVAISADRLTDKRTGAPYYTALVAADPQELAQSKEVELYPRHGGHGDDPDQGAHRTRLFAGPGRRLLRPILPAEIGRDEIGCLLASNPSP